MVGVGSVIVSKMVVGAVASKIRIEAPMSNTRLVDSVLDVHRSYSPCMHRNVVVDTSGSRRFVEGEVIDDILVRALCLDCGEYLTESEVRGTWSGELHRMDKNIQVEEDIYDEF
jgi:hypothetical protein